MGDSYYKSSDQILVVSRDIYINDWSSRRYVYVFDFEFRNLTVVTDYSASKERSEVHPFPSLDQEMLRRMRDKLVDMGGHPAPLEEEDDPRRAFVIPKPLKPADKGFKP